MTMLTLTRGFSLARATLGRTFATSSSGVIGRMLLALVAIALGVALGYSVQLINGAAVAEFRAGMTTLSGAADLQVRGPAAGFDENLYPAIARDPDIAVVSPVLEISAKVPGREEPLTLLGLDVFRAAAVTPALVGEAHDTLDYLKADTIFLSPAAARWLDANPGESVRLQVGLSDQTWRVAGLTHSDDAARYAVMDIAAAQARFGRAGWLTRLDLRLRPGAAPAVVETRLTHLLSPGTTVEPPQRALDATTRLTRAYRVNLDVLALVALFTGSLLVFSTQSLAVLRRRTQFALLRTLGLTRRGLVMLLVGEGLLLGIAGALLGLAAGYALATIATRIFGADLGAGFFRGALPHIAFNALTALPFGVLGVVAAVAGSFAPALEAARAAPAAALKAGDLPSTLVPLRYTALGCGMLAAGAAMTLFPVVDGLPVFGYLAIALLLLGTLMLLPRLARRVLETLPQGRFVPPALAIAQLRGSPTQIAVSLAAIVAGVSLMVSMAIMVASFRASLDTWLGHVLPADAYLRTGIGADSAFLAADDQRAIATLPAVARVEFLRATSVLLDPARPRVTLLARDIDPAAAADRLPLTRVGPALDPAAPSPVWVSEAVADAYAMTPGDAIALPLNGRAITFTLAGVWRDYARQQGAIVMPRSRYIAITGDTRVTDAALWLKPGTSLAALRTQLDAALPGADRLALSTAGEIRAVSLTVFDRTFAVTYALEAVAVIIGLTGLSSSFGALVLARRREFGVLRHLGMTRRQIGAMLATEGLVVSALGLAVGLLLGFAISLILIFVVNRQSFHWSMELHVPWSGLGALAFALLVLATLTALVSARRAMGDDVVRAVKDDW